MTPKIIGVLKGAAGEELQMVPDKERNHYTTIVEPLQRKYENEHRK